MILVLDVGNTNIKAGVFQQDVLAAAFRIATDRQKTSDEYGITLTQLLAHEGIKHTDIEGIIISSVVPTINYTLEHMIADYFGKTPMMVGPGIKTGINIRYDNPKELGSDRIVNAVAAHSLYGGPCIVIDFGTATTFGAVSAKAEFLGGCICPGLKVSADAMAERSAKLVHVELAKPTSVINRSTVSNMQAGLVYGYIGQVEYILRRIKSEMGEDAVRVIGTGGLAKMVADESQIIDVVNPELTLQGLKIIYKQNQ